MRDSASRGVIWPYLNSNLPDPHGPLALSVLSTSIAAVNSEMSTAIDTASRNSGKRGHYKKYTPQQKAMIGKTAAEHGVAASARHYMKDFSNLKENTVKTAYTMSMV